jgi:signal peptidase II
MTKSVISILLGLIAPLVADRLTKLYFMKQSADSGFVLFSGILESTRHQNYGVVANFPLPMLVIFILTAVAVFFLVLGLRSAWKKSDWPQSAYLLLILAGAAGNLWDRVQYGYVFDWILLFSRSALNLADIFIILGLLGYFFTYRPAGRRPTS